MIHTFTITQCNGNEHTVYINKEDRELVERYGWYVANDGYVCTNIRTQSGRTRVTLHRLLINPGELHIDHINRNKLDNRRCNLRVCTPSQNKRNSNKRSDNTTGYRGVSLERGKYRVQVICNGVNHRKGSYTSVHAAAIVANITRRELHGEYSVGDTTSTLHMLYYHELVH